ncbi:MAG: hypothetical protein WBP73_03660 [Terriglobales bacterium]
MTVTIERRIVAGIADIKAVRLKCKCGTEQVVLAEALMGAATRCSNANCTHWQTRDTEKLKKYLEFFNDWRTSSLPFETCFEFAGTTSTVEETGKSSQQ